ncbi:MAG: DUF72 domain-containing protein [Thermodesulfovibrionales bacterium]|jgi:uncharacterized protein YecE (DUF72 family)
MKIHAGTSGFGYREWKGEFYPEKIRPKEMLHFYAERLSVVEINNTFYRMPREETLSSWKEEVPDDFVFAIKSPQVITHLKQLRNVEAETRYLFDSLAVLDRKLGPILFQFPRSFHAAPPLLKDFMDLIPGSASCAFEFRSASRPDSEILHLLRERRYSLCITDTDESPAAEIISTASWGYLRLRRSDYSDAELAQWTERILSQKWERAFVFFKHEEEAKAPQMAIRFQELSDSGIKKLHDSKG